MPQTPTRPELILALFLAASLLPGCGRGKSAEGTMGPPGNGEPVSIGRGLYRGALNGRQGLLFFAASAAAMTLVYDTARCGLYMAWRGPVPGNASATDSAYVPQGPLYHLQEADTLWHVDAGGETLPLKPMFLGFEQDSLGYLILRYSLDLPGGKTLRVEEHPAYDDHYGDIALRREFTFSGLQPGMTASVRLGGKSFTWKELWSQSADGSLAGTPGEETLTLSEDGVADVKLTFEGSAL
ncbi:MAG: hypothetical protein JWO30_4305 [Fibrobacteres bacterium]|nr:hypothetical protein [Fibrobacterota bacterium]